MNGTSMACKDDTLQMLCTFQLSAKYQRKERPVVIVKIKKDKEELSVVMVAALSLVPKFIPSISKCPVQSLKKAAPGFLPSERHFDGQHKFPRCRPWKDQRKTGFGEL